MTRVPYFQFVSWNIYATWRGSVADGSRELKLEWYVMQK